MKQLNLCVFLLVSSILFSQRVTRGDISALRVNESSSKPKGSYEFKQSVPVKIVSELNFKDSILNVKKGHRITYLYDLGENAHFKYWPFAKGDSLSIKTYNNDGRGDLIFSMKRSEFERLVRPLYKRYKGISYGMSSVPFKIRSNGQNDSSLETSASLQVNIISGFGSIYREESWLYFSLGLGMAQINLNSQNSNVSENRTASALTYSLGLMVNPFKYTSVGLFIGQDKLGETDSGVNWTYDRQSWVGFGVSVNLNEIISSNKSIVPKNQKGTSRLFSRL